MPIILDTSNIAPGRRVDYWLDECVTWVGTGECISHEKKNFFGSLDFKQIGPLSFGGFQAGPQTCDRRREHLRTSDPDHCFFSLLSGRTMQVDHNDRRSVQTSGIVMFDVTVPHLAIHPDEIDLINVFVPRKQIEDLIGPARLMAGLCIEPTQKSYLTIANFLRDLYKYGDSFDPRTAERMSTIAVDLIAAGMAERTMREPTRKMSGVSILHRAKSYIDSHLSQTGLNLEDVAQHVGVTVRSLQRIASEDGISIHDWMWERRLKRAHALLTDPANKSVSLGEIAYMSGFINQAHFSRRFKERYTESPSEARGQSKKYE